MLRKKDLQVSYQVSPSGLSVYRCVLDHEQVAMAAALVHFLLPQVYITTAAFAERILSLSSKAQYQHCGSCRSLYRVIE
jgi:primosomal replication protein N